MRQKGCELSIIIPCYNAGKFISDTVTMFESQSINDCEIIIINDGSQDNTLEIITSLKEKYSNVLIVDQKNEGVSVARNRGLKCATGKYVYFFDSDDRIEEGTLEYYKEIIKCKPKCEIYAFGYQMSRDGEIIRKYVHCKKREFIMEGKEVLENIFYGKLYFHICGCIFERKFLENYNLAFPEKIPVGEDGDFIRNCLAKAEKVYYSSRISFTYQLWLESQTMGNTYTLKTFNAFSFTLDSVEGVKNSVSLYAYNYFIAARYVYQILGYLKSDLRNSEIESVLKNYKYLVYQKIHIGNLKWMGGIILIRLIPLGLLFKIFK